METQDKRFWHYTVYQWLVKIIESREIKKAPSYVDGEIPVVWFSTNQIWEETVRKKVRPMGKGKHILLSRNGLFKVGYPPVRIEIDPNEVKIHSWKHHKKHSGIPKKIAVLLEKQAIEWGANPNEWWVSKKPVQLEQCLAPIEIWNGETWLDIESAFDTAT